MFSVSPALSALNAFGVVALASAGNIANVSTDGYKAEVVHLESGPQDRGVMVSAIHRDMSAGPLMLYNSFSENDVRVSNEVAARGMRNSQENYDTAQAQDVWRVQQADTSEAWRMQDYRSGQVAMRHIMGIREGSNTDLPREFVNLIATESAYSAQAAGIRAWDELTGSILNVKV